MFQQQPDNLGRSVALRRNHQGGTALIGAGVGVGAVSQQQAGLLRIVGSPHQRRGVDFITGVGIGAAVQQPLHRFSIAVEDSIHERGRSASTFSFNRFRMLPQKLLKSLPVSGSKRLHEPCSRRIGRLRRNLSCHFIRPYHALVDPVLDDLHLLFRQRAGRRHRRADAVLADQPQIEVAGLAAARRNDGNRSAAHGVAPPVEPKVVHLLRRPVTAVAVRFKNRLNIPAEFDFCRRLGIQHPTEDR